ncbi:hypothetical protein Q5H91_09405 [Sphingomonas sp. KR1UV-12]|uniref:Uncharacterized protein n=1 Tax=Sphingomonas aurea TaxID=3063994 RepID=A0ABT9EKD2_9SPHN|nr:hypothetical protein [Sphingomonas sp. KR1UV-12]MDP1027429.1 hypothetical protein [Sphingomonas sp. KR1UV-12]
MDMRHDAEVLELDAEDAIDDGGDGALFELGGDERRMHVRAYNHWVSLLKGRPFPAIADLDPARAADFGSNGVLLDFAQDVEDPAIVYLGDRLAQECALGGPIARVGDVPPRSLLSRLTDHHLQIIANRAPVGFEAEFVSTRGSTTLYRGILMPFSSSDADTIDFIYGVINWKEIADPAVQASLGAELAAAVRETPAAPVVEAPVWADGPGADTVGSEAVALPEGTLADALMMARETAAAVRAADTRSRAALYRALGRAHDFALAADADQDGYQRLVAEAGIAIQPRAPMTPVVKLVFGADYDKTRLTEFAAVLGHARRHGIAVGRLPNFLEGFEGGIKAIVAAERDARRPVTARPATTPALAERAVIARLPLAIESAAPGDAVVLVARMGADGVLDIVGSVADAGLAERVLKRG